MAGGNKASYHVVGVRIPIELYNKLAKLAAAEHRTMSNLVVKTLAEHYDAPAKPSMNGHAHKAAPKTAAAA